jgi:hypothetical protein
MTYLSGISGDYIELDSDLVDCADEGLPTYFLSVVQNDLLIPFNDSESE